MVADRVLDIGCGDGSISLPILSRCKHLTMLDLSGKMLDLAREKIPFDRTNDVELINFGSFIGSNLRSKSFDLILCLGVLAHVDSPAAVIAEIARLAKPGASIVLELTDSYHFWGVPVVVYQKLLKLARPEPYALNRLRHRQVVSLLAMTMAIQRICALSLRSWSCLPLADNSKFALYAMDCSPWASVAARDGQEEMYRMTRYLFGPSDRNRNSWMGNQFIYRYFNLASIERIISENSHSCTLSRSSFP